MSPEEMKSLIDFLESQLKGKKFWVIDPKTMSDAEIEDAFQQAELHQKLSELKRMRLDHKDEQAN